MTKTEMTQAEFMEIIAQSPKTKAEIIKRIEDALTKGTEHINEQNRKAMEKNGCTDWDIEFVKKRNDELLQPSILRALQMMGINLAYGPGPERKQ